MTSMDMRVRILRETRRLTIDSGAIPSLNAVAEAAGVSKGGLIHHFPTRDALVEGLAREALAEIDEAMIEAAARGRAADMWLRVSVPDESNRELFRALIAAHHALDGRLASLMREAAVATGRWEEMIATELGDAMQARILRLVGDGLAANAMLSAESRPSDAEIDSLIAAITGRPTSRP